MKYQNILYIGIRIRTKKVKIGHQLKVILCGGDSNLIGLAEYFSVSMKISVEMANVWVNITETENIFQDIGFGQSLTFASALGLALGRF